jgi:hypothetical protein
MIFPLAAVLMLAACSPGLDWRELRPQGADARVMFPCKPTTTAHPATPAEPVTMGLAQCEAAGQNFALSWAEVDDPAQLTAALRQMRESLALKMSATPGEPRPVKVPGMTPNVEAQQQTLVGAHQRAQVAVFTRGQRVYQALMLGARPNAAAWDTFIGSVQLGG